MVQTFSANRPDDAFHVSALPWRPRSAKDFFDSHDRDLVAELLSIDSIPVSQQICRCCVEGKSFDESLRSPFSRRMSRHVKVDDTSENDENEQDLKPSLRSS